MRVLDVANGSLLAISTNGSYTQIVLGKYNRRINTRPGILLENFSQFGFVLVLCDIYRAWRFKFAEKICAHIGNYTRVYCSVEVKRELQTQLNHPPRPPPFVRSSRTIQLV